MKKLAAILITITLFISQVKALPFDNKLINNFTLNLVNKHSPPTFFHQNHVKNCFHIGLGASGFTYFLWTTDINNKYWINTYQYPYIGFSYMPELTIQLGNRVSYYLSIGWTGMAEFYNMYYDKKANTLPPVSVDKTPIVGMTGISFALFGYEVKDEYGYNIPKDVYLSPARLSIGAGIGNFKWNAQKEYVSGFVAVISLEWYLFFINLGS